MSFLSKLKIDGTTYTVLSAEYGIEQSDDGTGLPDERPRGGKIFVRIESVKSTDLFEWATTSKSKKSGELILYNRDSISTFRKVEFKSAYCLKYFEKFDGQNNMPLYTEIIISAKTLDLKGSKFENDWPENA